MSHTESDPLTGARNLARDPFGSRSECTAAVDDVLAELSLMADRLVDEVHGTPPELAATTLANRIAAARQSLRALVGTHGPTNRHEPTWEYRDARDVRPGMVVLDPRCRLWGTVNQVHMDGEHAKLSIVGDAGLLAVSPNTVLRVTIDSIAAVAEAMA